MTLKEELFNKNTVTILADIINQVYPDFKYDDFIRKSVKSFPPLELKERMSSVRKYLKEFLPTDYVEAIAILTNAMNIRKEGGFIFGSVLEFVQEYGCTDEYVDLSLEKLGEWTSSLSSEFAIRPFLDNYPNKTMMKVLEWTTDEDVHKRRLASEGLRPSLPWGPNITMSYLEAAKPLDLLYFDKERYVTRSVANHLNDISKIDPMFVLNLLNKWKKEGKQKQEELAYMIKHSLRTLIKKGHPETLEFLGYKLNPDIKVTELRFDKEEITIGETITFDFDIHSNDNCKIIIDYTVVFPSVSSVIPKKTFKLTNLDIRSGEVYNIKGKKTFKHMSTRKMRTGVHVIQIHMNGVIGITKKFVIK